MPAINDAFQVGTPILPRTVPLNEDLERVLEELDEVFENPNTLLALRDLRTAVTVTTPALEFIAPYQTVCGYSIYFLNALGEHQSFTTLGGTVQNQNLKFPNMEQPNTFANNQNGRPWDIPTGSAATTFPWNAPERSLRRRVPSRTRPPDASSRRPTRWRSTPRATPTASSARSASRADRCTP